MSAHHGYSAFSARFIIMRCLLLFAFALFIYFRRGDTRRRYAAIFARIAFVFSMTAGESAIE